MRQGSDVTVLLVEDNPGDVRLVQHSVEMCDRPISLTVAEDGEKALAALADGKCAPDLVILDLNIPKVSGLAVLELTSAARDTPFVIFSSSCNMEEIRRAINLGAREYICKPLDINEFIAAVCGIIQRWTS